MIAHPKPQKTKTPSHHARKLVHKSIDIALKLIGFVGLYFYSILEPFYGSGTSHFKNTTNNIPPPRIPGNIMAQDSNQEKEIISKDTDTGKWTNIHPGN